MSSKFIMFVVVLAFLIITAVAGIAAMLVMLAKKGDERRSLIITKAGFSAFATMVCLLILDFLEKIFNVFQEIDGYSAIKPFTLLASCAAVFFFHILYLNKKYGS